MATWIVLFILIAPRVAHSHASGHRWAIHQEEIFRAVYTYLGFQNPYKTREIQRPRIWCLGSRKKIAAARIPAASLLSMLAVTTLQARSMSDMRRAAESQEQLQSVESQEQVLDVTERVGLVSTAHELGH